MKKINMLAAVVALVLSASCDRSIEFQHETFATFDAVSFAVDETAGKVRIPVSIYNPTGSEIQVSVKGVDGSAKVSEDFELSYPASGILTFSADKSTDTLEFAIKPYEGVFTNNKDFTVEIASVTSGVSTGLLRTAKVTIKDVDHPLASILGNYSAAGVSAASGAYAWDVVIDKNDDSVQMVNVISFNDWGETLVGLVSEDMNTIIIPFGQMYVASGYDTMFVGWGAGGYYAPSGNLILTKTATGWIQSTDIDDDEMSWGIGALAVSNGTPLGWLDYMQPGIVLTKK